MYIGLEYRDDYIPSEEDYELTELQLQLIEQTNSNPIWDRLNEDSDKLDF
ncbi:MAG: hypothetical protein ACM3KR_01100 [Deltaproteobacteria bacterium]